MRTIPWTSLSSMPLKWHLAAAVVCISAAALGAFLVSQSARSTAANARTGLLTAEQTLASLKSGRTTGAAPPSFGSSLQSPERTDDVIREIGRLGQAHGVQISSLTIQKQAASAREWGQVRFSMAAQGSYSSFKLLLAELQGRYPALSVQSLSLRGLPAEPKVDIQLGLLLYVRDGV